MIHKAILFLAANDHTHAIDILKCLIQGSSKTHQPVGYKARDIVVADAVDHATWNNLPVAARLKIAIPIEALFLALSSMTSAFLCAELTSNAELDSKVKLHFASTTRPPPTPNTLLADKIP